MITFVYVLALLFFTITNGQETSWTAAGQNDTITNSANWNNGIPTADSIVYINDTIAGTSFTVEFDEDFEISELHVNSTSPTITIKIIGVKLSVTKAFTFSNPSPSAWIYIEITEGGSFEIGPDCVATIYPIYASSASIYGDDNTENWFINQGSITVLGNPASTSVQTVQIGYSSSFTLHVDSWGTWDVSDASVFLSFSDIKSFNIYGGSLLGSWIDSDSVSIGFDDTNVIFQEGSGGDDTGAPAVVIEYLYFDSTTSQSTTNFNTVPPKTVIFNTTGVTVSNAEFSSINIVFLYDGTLQDSNLTDYAVVNTTVSGVHAYFTGECYFVSYVIFSAYDSTDFIIKVVDYESSFIHISAYIYFFGPVTVINNGTWSIEGGGWYTYWDTNAYFVNLGVFDVQDYHYITGISFPGLAATSAIGTLVNMGTVQFTDGGYFTYQDATGSFRQCSHGILKFDYETTDAGESVFGKIFINGYIAALYRDTFTFSSFYGEDLFSWKDPTGTLPQGKLSYVYSGPDSGDLIPLDVPQLLCLSTDTNTATVWAKEDLEEVLGVKVCPDKAFNFFQPYLDGDACSDLDASIKDLADSASCPAGNNCGVDTGAPPGEDNNDSAASLNVASLAFLVSLVCLLLKF
jgi:hypothetical protein